ncbi:outer membrane lipoprotein chaperone LolA [Thioalkalivibrio sp. XN279]|uniref:outer membrane lipoprotein chaperone LolA n=1 Tax=Thioalkalivibrio sp. XN279 TaxID=2714953 RepID=UPI00140DF3B7|nr:outer membrane lipoprotein chaperone LolA [Thioalkalivibrio sp. XN279]NHA14326.1 outer membrane lipoprotein chaperone LolA [Thioalkalivibrio sp. XN279]
MDRISMMRRFPCFACAALALLAVAAAWAPAAARAQDVPGTEQPSRAPELLRAFLAETVTLEAAFSQVLLEADSQHTQVSTGRFYLHRPQRFRWDYEAPVPQLVVADGENLWLYDPDLEQATMRRLDDGLSSTPAMLLSGDGSLDDSFRIGAAYREDGFDWVELAPLSGEADFAGVRVGFVDGVLASMELIDALGQTTIIRFEEVVVNEPLDAALFQFVPPPGADVIRDAGY